MRRLMILFSYLLCALATPATAVAATPNDVLDKDLERFVDWFPGRYDNDLQVFFEPDLGVPEDERHGRIHSVFAPVDMPAMGEHVFYVEQYSGTDPANIYRQRVYVFEPDYDEGAIRLIIYTPKDVEAVKGAYLDASKVEALDPDQLRRSPEGCDVFWKRREAQFDGYMKTDACRITSSRTGQTIVINDDLLLTEDALWINDQARTETGEYVFGNIANVPNKLQKARPFVCWVGVLRGADHGDSGEGMSDWWFKRGLWLHDRGGVLRLRTDDGAPKDVDLRLRRVAWPYGTRRPSMTLYVHEADNDRALSYAWTEHDGERVGINLRWLQASCTHTPEAAFGP